MLTKRKSRGVLMTATTRRPHAPAFPREQDTCNSDGEHEDAEEAKHSQREWSVIERVVREEKRLIIAKEQFASGNRGSVVVYDDAVGDEDESDKPNRRIDAGDRGKRVNGHRSEAVAGDMEQRSPSDSASPPVQGFSLPEDRSEAREELVRPSGAVTAGQDQRSKKRGGQKETGGSKRIRKKTVDDESTAPKRDPDKWVKLKLDGEKAAKKIDATRVVHYHDFDSNGALFQDEKDEDVPAPPVMAEACGNYRAGLRMDLFEPGSDEDDDSRELAQA